MRRVLAFSEHELVTSPAVVASVREAVGAARAGVRGNEPELRRAQPGPARPQLGGRLLRSAPTLRCMRQMTGRSPRRLALFSDMLRSARSFLGDRPIVVEPRHAPARGSTPTLPAPAPSGWRPSRQPIVARRPSSARASRPWRSNSCAAGGAEAVDVLRDLRAPVACHVLGWRCRRTRLGAARGAAGRGVPRLRRSLGLGQVGGPPRRCVCSSSDPRSVDGAACLAERPA